MTGATDTNDWLRNAAETLRQDPRKALLLTGLGAVMLVLWGRLLFGGGAVRPAGAAIAPDATKSNATDSPAPGGRGAGVAASLNAWLAAPISMPDRNVFAIKLDYFQQDGPRGDGISDRLAKSAGSEADQKKERQILIENLRTQAAGLQLQSTVMGAEPRAMVNGTLVGEGDVVAGFRVEKIEPRCIIVEREGIRLQIAMN
jgi:hypothetical protein